MSTSIVESNHRARVIYLYLVARRAVLAALAIFTSGGLIWILLAQSLSPNAIHALVVAAPLLPALVIGVSVWSPFGEVEQIAGRPLWPIRLIHCGGLFLCAVAALEIIGLVEPAVSRTQLLRNLAGYTGLAWIGTRVAGPAFTPIFVWVLPITYVALIWAVDGHRWWTWAKQPAAVESATAIAVLLLATGLTLMLRTPRSSRMNGGDVA